MAERSGGLERVRILRDGEDPASMPVETAKEYTYVVNEAAAERQGVTIPEDMLADAEKLTEDDAEVVKD